MWKKWFVIVGIGLFGFLVVFLSLESRPPEEEDSGEEENNEETAVVQPVVMQGTRIRGWENGRLSWILQAREMEFNKETTQALCRGEVELLVYQENGDQQAVLTAQEATINLDQKDFSFRREVQVVSADQNRIYTNVLLYQDQSRTLESNVLSQTYFGENYIESLGLKTDIDFEQPVFMDVQQGRFMIQPSRGESTGSNPVNPDH